MTKEAPHPDGEKEVARRVVQELEKLDKQSPAATDTKGSPHRIYNRNVANYLLEHHTPPIPLEKALQEAASWTAHIRHARVDLDAAVKRMRDNGVYDDANALDRANQQLEAVARDLDQVHDHLITLRKYKQGITPPQQEAGPRDVKAERKAKKERDTAMYAVKDLMTTLDKAHADLGDKILNEVWTVRRSQLSESGFNPKEVEANPAHPDLESLGLSFLDSACMRLQRHLMSALDEQIGAIYMMAIEEKVRMDIAQQRKLS